jgi:lysyl-tRNA synthetase class 2
LEKGDSSITAGMRRNLDRLRERGVDPYPRRYKRTHLSADIAAGFDTLEGAEVSIAGRITAVRGHGKACFADITDPGGKIQIYIRKDDIGDEAYAVWDLLDVGDIVGVRGEAFKTKTGEISVKVLSLTVLAKAVRPLPEKWHGLKDKELRYRRRYLDLIANEDTRSIFLLRSRLLQVTRTFLAERGFLEVETPVLQPIYGGAFAKPFVTHHHALDMPLYLRIADELYLKRLIVGGFERVFEIGKDFRNEGMDRTHSPEFTQLELYQAYADYEDMMELTESLFVRLARDVLGGTSVTWQDKSIDLTPPWKRFKVADAVRQALGGGALSSEAAMAEAASAKGVELPERPSMPALIEKVLDELVEPNLIEPTFLVDYPLAISPLAKVRQDEPETAERFEVFVGGLELGNSFTELNDPGEQRARFELQQARREGGDAEAQGMDEDFIQALEHGMPPTGGLGIGLDRLVMLFAGCWNIRDVILFPPMRPAE